MGRVVHRLASTATLVLAVVTAATLLTATDGDAQHEPLLSAPISASSSAAAEAAHDASVDAAPTAPSTPVVTPANSAPPVPPAPPPPDLPLSGNTVARGQAALAQINYPWHRTGFRIEFRPGQPGYLGTTSPSKRLIVLYVRDGQTTTELARILAHEVGHAVDVSSNDQAERDLFRRLRGIGAGSWFSCGGCSDFTSPAGDFAETFAHWLLGPGTWRSKMGPVPDAGTLAQLAPLFMQ